MLILFIRKLTLALGCTGGAFGLGWFARDSIGPDTRTSPVARPEEARSDAEPQIRPPREANNLTPYIRVVPSAYMHWEDAYRRGTWPDRNNPEITVDVRSSVGHGVPSVVNVDRWTGFGHVYVTLRFDAVTKHVEAQVESKGDTYPAPAPEWEDVGGLLYVSDMEWGSGRGVVLDYSLYGVRGCERVCVHEKVFVDL